MNRTHLSLHLSDDQLIAHLYGIGDESAKLHLDTCQDCQIRWAEIELRRRASVTEVAPASEDIFVRQRRIVLENPHHPTPLRSAWLPAGAAVLALAGIVFLRPSQPSRTLPPAVVSQPAPILEVGWFDEAYASSASVEPRAAQPLRELFSSGEQMP